MSKKSDAGKPSRTANANVSMQNLWSDFPFIHKNVVPQAQPPEARGLSALRSVVQKQKHSACAYQSKTMLNRQFPDRGERRSVGNYQSGGASNHGHLNTECTPKSSSSNELKKVDIRRSKTQKIQNKCKENICVKMR
uniref:(northern house mosquito) hypothetical protein n=1 Tax=Culex pipiens TaxID=7175 RepID=A0A8D8KFQ5_CULPI